MKPEYHTSTEEQQCKPLRAAQGHTPGPWKLDDGGDGEIEVWAGDISPSDTICEVREYKDRETALANARLIAAAPDLLAACKLMQVSHPYNAMVNAAIAKAEGH